MVGWNTCSLYHDWHVCILSLARSVTHAKDLPLLCLAWVDAAVTLVKPLVAKPVASMQFTSEEAISNFSDSQRSFMTPTQPCTACYPRAPRQSRVLLTNSFKQHLREYHV